mmetsp:Transcript_5251/g.15696  ORF Transcript_5251/g.15696 Transcript_5251/m.15696 type:complete len:504 (+) Transcript_5251:187-1698(+)|eukprot:CAMPEP_0198728094 /NCGR_PEP_ID=MMETSP1475-20131203/6719_1 /TAXON_ID= ORGANISM="Unidentified sp., Strain CCMP1999" /NCGR_SAMPLE_ID=MMETSP1475 /ASSEMBLY_ACC=CAM_ASM_001111 /LENGTH=503 /DNA_ID=CAMNT_0044490343 /DNA_START=147 /DNA_END=1658 /DNA_ORIENTATION=+
MSSSTEVTEKVSEDVRAEESESAETPGGDGKEEPAVDQITEGVKKTAVDWADDEEEEDKENGDAGGGKADGAGGEKAETEPEAEADEEEEVSGIDAADRTAEVQVLQSNPNTPYFSAKTFEELGLQEPLMKGLYAMKFNKPSKIQATSLPMIFSPERTNLIGQAHNGSGKTGCFVLGMLNQIDFSKRATQALCVAPTRELARQIHDVIKAIGRFTPVEVFEAIPSETKVTRVNAHVVVGTPGKVMDLIKRRKLERKDIKVFVLDEADEMVSQYGFGDDTIRIKQWLPADVQTLLFSATFEDEVRSLASKIATNANMITVKREQLSLDSIKQFYFECKNSDHRFEVLSDIYASLQQGQSIIFVRTRRTASELATHLRADGHTVSLLYGGDMSTQERDRVIDEFRAGTTKVLLTTNVLSRGVDVPQVTVVINYDLPTDKFDQNASPEVYMHRIGRTGRFGRKGIAINFVHDAHTKRVLKQIEAHYKHGIERVRDVEELEEKIAKL